MRLRSTLGFAFTLTLLSFAAVAQEATVTPTGAPVVPHLVRYSGTLPDVVAGRAAEVRFAVYGTRTGGEPLWAEVQQVSPDASGRYSVLLGVVSALPDAVFAAGEARWVGVSVAGGEEGVRSPLTAAVYALKAEDAQTLGGHPVSDFALAGVKPRPDAGTDITQINVSSGILGGGTGPTVSLSADPSYFNANYAQLAAANTFSATNTFSKGWASTVATGTAPFTVASTTAVPNLNASLLGGVAAAGFPQLALQNTYAGNQIIAASAPATTSTGHSSNFLWLNASVYNSAKAASQNIGFQWRAEPLANNTASPNANFALLSTVTSATPQETGFKITANGIVTFVAGQTFPGAGTITGVTAGTGLTGGGTSGAVTLAVNAAALETTYDARYAQLGAANTYADPQTVSSTETITGTAPLGGGYGAYTGQLTVNSNNTSSGTAITANSSYTGIISTGAVGVLGFGAAGDDAGTGLGTGLGLDGVGGIGVYGEGEYSGSQVSGVGIYGAIESSYAGTGPAPMGVYGANSFSSGYGVFGIGPSSGVFGTSASTGAYGVYGSVPSDGSWGVKGVMNAPSVAGQFITANNFGSGVWADTDASESSNAGPALYATADDNYAAAMVNDSAGSVTLSLVNRNSGGTSNKVPVFSAAGEGGVCGVSGTGDITCSGRLKTAVQSGGRSVETYSVQSAENWFEDFGSARLRNGGVHVSLEPQFASIVNTGVEYHVFLTPKGDCKGLYVTDESPDGFAVREMGGGTSAVAFDYRIVAKRSGHESERLEDATEAMRQMTAPREHVRQAQAQTAANPESARRHALPAVSSPRSRAALPRTRPIAQVTRPEAGTNR